MTTTTLEAGLTTAERQGWSTLVRHGIARSIAGFSAMVGAEVQVVTQIEPSPIAIKDAVNLVGGPEAVQVAAYLRVKGETPGHMLLLLKPESAYALVDMLLNQPQGTTRALDEMARSALGETGNIMSSSFLNALGDATGSAVLPSPPAVMMDMAGSMLDAALCEISMESDEVLLANAVFGTGDRHINGAFLVLPSSGMVRKLLAKGVSIP